MEIGCGVGTFARHFVGGGYRYWGIDPDAERIAKAARHVSGAKFLVGEGQNLAALGLPQTRYYFIHGVLHHLNDADCCRLIDSIFSQGPDMVLAVIEPYAPRRW